MALTAQQRATAIAAVQAAQTAAGNPNYTPTEADIQFFANDPAASAAAVVAQVGTGTPVVTAAQVTADLQALATEAQANNQSITQFLAQVLTYLEPVLKAL